MSWPTADLDRVQRLRVLEAALPGTVLVEYRVERPFDEVWGWLADLEQSGPAFDSDVHRLNIVQRDGSSLRIRANGPWWVAHLPLPFDVELTEGWCWMVSRPQVYVVGMAAEPDGDATRCGHLEGVALPGSRWTRALAEPVHTLSRWRHQHHVPADVAGIQRSLA